MKKRSIVINLCWILGFSNILIIGEAKAILNDDTYLSIIKNIELNPNQEDLEGGSDQQIVNIPDYNLEKVIREELNKPTGNILKEDMITLTQLNGEGKGITNLEGIENAINLEKLDLRENKIIDISPLEKLNSLTTLILYSNQITDISSLSNLKNLMFLSLDENQISNITPISSLMNLKTLYLSDNQITDISPVANLSNLTSLGLVKNQITDISPITNLTNLTDLYLYENQIVNISSIAGLENLKFLSLWKNQIVDISPLEHFTHFTYLSLDDNQITDISPIKNFTNLSDLSLNGNQIKDISPIASMKSLTYLSLDKNQITDISPVTNLTNLTNLSLNQNQITDISAVTNLKNLEALYLNKNQIKDISPVTNLINLVNLYLYQNKIIDVSPVENLTKLRNLDLDRNPLKEGGDEKVTIPDKKLEEAIKKELNITPEQHLTLGDMWQLENLYADNQGITDLSGLEHAEKLKQLGLSNNKLYNIKPLENLTNLTYLRLDYNPLDSLVPLRGLVNLWSLSLEGSNVTDISEISNLKKIHQTDLSHNRIEDITPLSNLPTLMWLDISYNHVTDIKPLLENLENGLPIAERGKFDVPQFDVTYNYIDIAENSLGLNIVNELKGKGVRMIYESQAIKQDELPPEAPKVSSVGETSKEITGIAEAGSRIMVDVNGTVVGTAVADTDGKFNISIPKQEAGTTLAITATDKAGNVSESTIVIVKKETVYKQLETKINVDPHYDFTVKFNNDLDAETVTSSNVYVKTNSTLVDGVKVSLNADKRSVKVQAPEAGYKAGETYIIYVEKAVKSASGKELKEPVKMQFKVTGNN
ncbi:leucine-rich repeat domain-containing protein [Domibacillus sp. PGB-M46]|uniref:leucine-rich repeat domain-containing protein n=1 Tax=Domibacillus sp. PGB-M46 TaxID=2910255 RepID=UPI001F58F470|nr:leucine-rich repeat domain-containing protein [Domibacillus sp. PGB-M46]MCI2254210.1 leucine-rich repeat domain-containing protein [Domibacillus sp. PGB-M46]